jgi:predicted nuclease with TOPRIM domain
VFRDRCRIIKLADTLISPLDLVLSHGGLGMIRRVITMKIKCLWLILMMLLATTAMAEDTEYDELNQKLKELATEHERRIKVLENEVSRLNNKIYNLDNRVLQLKNRIHALKY